MAEFKQIRLNPEVRGLLDDYKMEGESYSIAIGRLFKENEILRESMNKIKVIPKLMESIESEENYMNDSRDSQMNNYVYFVLNECLENKTVIFDSGSDIDMVNGIFGELDLALNMTSESYKKVLKIIGSYKKEHEEYESILTELEEIIMIEYVYDNI